MPIGPGFLLPQRMWKRRLLCVATGVLLIVASFGWYLMVSRRPYPNRDWVFYHPAYLGVLKPAAYESNLPCIQELGNRKREALLLIPELNGNGFQPVFANPQDPYAHINTRARKPIPESLLDFEPSRVMEAYAKTAGEHLLVNDFAEAHKLKRWQTRTLGDFLELSLLGDRLALNYTKLTLYTQKDSRLQTIFPSSYLIVAWDFLENRDPLSMLVNYSDGMEGYSWNGHELVADPAVKEKDPKLFWTLCLSTWRLPYFYGSMFMQLTALILWLYRAIRFAFLKFSGRPYRQHPRPRTGGPGCLLLGCLFPLVLFITCAGTFMNWRDFGPYFPSMVLAFAGWLMIAIGAILANRTVGSDITANPVITSCGVDAVNADKD